MGVRSNTKSLLQTIHQIGQLAPDKSSPLPNVEEILKILLTGQIELQGLMPWSSNYTFLVELVPHEWLAIYKPGAGERPLWDFPYGTLCHREFVSYLVSLVLGWPNIPPTVLRDGPEGPGSVQLFIEAEYEAHYFNMRDSHDFAESFRQIALFDFIANNADRKGGHCLKDAEGRLWAIDHGLTFHTDYKLRTVIWEFSHEQIPPPLLHDLERLYRLLEGELAAILGRFIRPEEVQAVRRRIETLLTTGQLPGPLSRRYMPYPPL